MRRVEGQVCSECGMRRPVAVEFDRDEAAIVLCAVCLENALDVIDPSAAEPVDYDEEHQDR